MRQRTALMGVAQIIAEAEARGLKLQPEGAGIRVQPRSALTPDLRAAIVANKTSIIHVLLTRAWPPSSSVITWH